MIHKHSDTQWFDHTFFPWTQSPRVGPSRTGAPTWKKPLAWQHSATEFAQNHGRRPRVLCPIDAFDCAADPNWRSSLFALIAATPDLNWILLTSHIGNAQDMIQDAVQTASLQPKPIAPIPAWSQDAPWDNVWIGAIISRQAQADTAISKLLATPSARRLVYASPLMGRIDLDLTRAKIQTQQQGQGQNSPCANQRWIDWVVASGECGAGAHPTHPDWVRALRDHCSTANVPFYFTHWGEWETAYQRSDGTPVFRQFDNFQQWVNKAASWVCAGICLDRHGKQLYNGHDMAQARDNEAFPVTIMHRVGSKQAGRTLDGITHNQSPG